MARALGADVVGAVGSPEKLEHVLSLGAGNAVTYDALSEVEPVDVILDQVGGELFSAGLKLLRPLGTIVGIGFAGGAWQPRPRAARRPQRLGVGLLPRSLHEAAAGGRPRRGVGAPRAVVGRCDRSRRRGDVPARAADALRLVAERRSTGKVVLVP